MFYRDGVAENQFDEVLKAEYRALRDACAELEEGYCPPITFVVVLKRHGTRREFIRLCLCLCGFGRFVFSGVVACVARRVFFHGRVHSSALARPPPALTSQHAS